MTPDLLRHFIAVKPAGSGWMARCPAHDDGTASLAIAKGDAGGWILHCHAGCAPSDVVTAAGLTMADLQPETNGKPRIVTTYDYTDARGTLEFQVVRYEPKDFRQRKPDGHGGWIANTKGCRPFVYRLDRIQKKSTLLIVEGEKDVDRLWGLGYPATCNAGGAGKWRPAHTTQIKDAGVQRVIVMPDRDAPGQAHADNVARSCAAAGLTVKVVPLPAPQKDVSAWLDAGGTKAELDALITSTAVYEPTLTELAHADVAEPPIVTSLSTVARASVEWIWPQRFARGKLCIIAGEPGEGKSTMLIDVAARCTRGAGWPDGGRAPAGAVLILSAEDGLSDTIAPRFDAAGGDDTRVHVLEAIRTLDGRPRSVDLGRDLAQLEAAVRQVRPVMLIIDPVSAYLPKVDTWRDSDVRSVLAPLAALAERYGCVAVLVMHLTKNASAKILHRLLGSVGFVAAARIVLAVATDPDDAARRLLLPVKSNISAPAPVLAFRRVDGRIAWDDEPIDGITADTVMSASASDPHERQDAETLLRQMLAGAEPVLATDVYTVARKNGISDAALKRAKARVGVRSRLQGFGRDGRWLWWLPATENSQRGQRVLRDPSDPSGLSASSQRSSEGSDELSGLSIKTLGNRSESTEGSHNAEERGGHDGEF
jgi:hypothetical protein